MCIRDSFVSRSARVCALVKKLHVHGEGEQPKDKDKEPPQFVQLEHLVTRHLLQLDPDLRGKFSSAKHFTYRRFSGEFFVGKVKSACR